MFKAVLSLLFAFALTGCARSVEGELAAPRVVAPGTEALPYAYRPGYGVVEDVWRVESRPRGTAAAGGTIGRVVDRVAYRLTVEMDDGTVQTILQDSPDFDIGDRVALTDDGRVVRIESAR